MALQNEIQSNPVTPRIVDECSLDKNDDNALRNVHEDNDHGRGHHDQEDHDHDYDGDEEEEVVYELKFRRAKLMTS